MGIRLNKVLTQLNIGTETVVEYLKSKPGLEPTKEMNPNTKVTDEQYEALIREFAPDMQVKERANNLFKKKSKKEKANKRNSFSGNVSNPNTEASNNNDTISESESVQEENKESEIISVSLSKLHYETNCIIFKKDSEEFVLWRTGISRYLNTEKNDNSNINNVSTKILLNYPNHAFVFLDASILTYLIDLSSRLENDDFEKHLKKVERKKEQQQKKNQQQRKKQQRKQQQKKLHQKQQKQKKQRKLLQNQLFKVKKLE